MQEYYRVESSEAGLRARQLFQEATSDTDTGMAISVSAYAEGSILRIAADDEIELIANGGSARARIWKILDDFKVSPSYPKAVLDEVENLLQAPGLDEPDLIDMRDKAFITIDNEDSRDLDQAMFIERLSDGYRVFYALADAAYYVPVASALFADALHRGSSYYLPEMSVPMLPTPLSEGLISLNADVERRALVFVISLDATANVTDTIIHRAKIKSRAKLSYDGVQAFHDDSVDHPFTDRDFCDTLLLLKEVGNKRIALARERNVVEYDRVGLQVDYSDNGERFVIGVDERNDVESWNEQISLLCNHEGANLLLRAQAEFNIQPVYRVHLAPELGRLKKFSAMLNSLISAHDLNWRVWKWRWRDGQAGEKETIAEYLRRLPSDPPWSALRRTIEYQARLLNTASLFSAEPGPHHSLKLSGYARFSSPMREIAGIYTHQEITDFCACGRVDEPTEENLALREKVIAAANASRQRQKKLSKAVYKLAMDDLFATDLELPMVERPLREATVFGMRASRLYLRLDFPPLDVKLYLADLEKALAEKLTVNRQATMLTKDDGKVLLRLGSRLSIRTVDYDASRDRWIVLPDSVDS